jgi:SAM-dependent methyltransferase
MTSRRGSAGPARGGAGTPSEPATPTRPGSFKTTSRTALVRGCTVAGISGDGEPLPLGNDLHGLVLTFDSVIAAHMVGPDGQVVGIDMTPAMLETARTAAAESGVDNVEFREGYMEELPVPDGWADVVISNGALNLTPDKQKVLSEMFRVLRPGGRLQVADIVVSREVPEEAKRKIDLWTG